MRMIKAKEKVGWGTMKTYLLLKRFLDIVLLIVALVVLSPIFLVVSILDRIGDNKGPLFYRQVRIGLNGKSFKIIKFRSMVVNADERLRANPELYQEYIKNSYKLPEGRDPRITSLGHFLRKTSVDEIPQFINVLKGEMALIGPRPVVEEELSEYGKRVDKLLSVKPGAMGYWQASGRSNIGYPQRCEIELFYVDHASLSFDIKIFFKNIISIFRSEGAY